MSLYARGCQRLGLLVAIALLSVLTTPQSTLAHGADDDYPAKWRDVAQDSVFDDWRMFNRECVSFVAWRLSSRNGFTMPFHDNADKWGPRAQAIGYLVNKTPAVGAVAWWDWTHVAWVQSVSADGRRVHIEEYNKDFNGKYSHRDVDVSTVTGFIHFKDLEGNVNPSTTNPLDNGKFVSYHGAVYRIAGRAPLYVSGQDAGHPDMAGWASATVINDAQWASLRPFPDDGTYISDVQTGMVYVTVGGAPMYISGADAPYLPNWTHAMRVPHWDFANYQHLRQYPADGYYLADVQSGFVYTTAGGAAFYVASQDAPALPQWQYATRIPHWELTNHMHIRSMPADGTYIADVQTGAVYITLGGAPMYISGSDAPYLPNWAGATRVSHWEFDHWSSLRPYPADGYYLRDVQVNAVYVTAGGAPLYVSGQNAQHLPQWQYASPVPHWELQNYTHFRQLPMDGTYVRGVPSGEVFQMVNGVAVQVTINPPPAATNVDDWAIVNQLRGTL